MRIGKLKLVDAFHTSIGARGAVKSLKKAGYKGKYRKSKTKSGYGDNGRLKYGVYSDM